MIGFSFVKKIAVLIPCFNEEKTIEKVITDFKNNTPEGTVIYVFDNNSTDQTAELAGKAGAVVVKEPLQGKGNVIRSMFRKIDADCYLMVDGDDTYPAEYASQMCDEVINNQADMVVGDRLSSTYFSENKRPFHNSGNVMVRYLFNRIWKKNKCRIYDVMTGYRAFSRQFVKSFAITSHGFEIETEMTIHALDKNMVIKNIPIEYRDRPEGSTSKLNTFSDGFKVIFTIFRLFREYKPLHFFGILAVMFLLLSVVLGIPVLIDFFTTGTVPKFPSLIVSAASMAISVQLFICGLILDNISVMHKKDFELYLISISSKNDQL